MSFLVDTDNCSAYVKGVRAVVNRFSQYGGRLYITVVTLGELLTWALRAQAPPGRRQVGTQSTGAGEAQGRTEDSREVGPGHPDRRTLRPVARRSRDGQRPHAGRLFHAVDSPADAA